MERSGSTAEEREREMRGRGTRLRALAAHRRRKALTQRQLGDLAGVAHTTVQQLESVMRGGYPETIRKLATALGVEPEDLVSSQE